VRSDAIKTERGCGASCLKGSTAMTFLKRIALGAMLSAFTGAADAQSFENWGGTAAWIEIHEPDDEHGGARAQVTFHNEMVHGPDDNECFPLTLN
jgi:hypothetical protein